METKKVYLWLLHVRRDEVEKVRWKAGKEWVHSYQSWKFFTWRGFFRKIPISWNWRFSQGNTSLQKTFFAGAEGQEMGRQAGRLHGLEWTVPWLPVSTKLSRFSEAPVHANLKRQKWAACTTWWQWGDLAIGRPSSTGTIMDSSPCEPSPLSAFKHWPVSL